MITELSSNVDPGLPLVYRIAIPALGVVYHGKAKNGAGRPRKDYARNLRRMLAGKPRRTTPGQEGYRPIHKAMFKAVEAGHPILLTLLVNCPGDELNATERWWIDNHNRGL